MPLIILKPNPSAARGRMHCYHITVISREGVRSTYAVMALTGRAAIDQIRAMSEQRAVPQVAA